MSLWGFICICTHALLLWSLKIKSIHHPYSVPDISTQGSRVVALTRNVDVRPLLAGTTTWETLGVTSRNLFVRSDTDFGQEALAHSALIYSVETVPANLGVSNSTKCLGMLQHFEFPSLEKTGRGKLLKTSPSFPFGSRVCGPSFTPLPLTLCIAWYHAGTHWAATLLGFYCQTFSQYQHQLWLTHFYFCLFFLKKCFHHSPWNAPFSLSNLCQAWKKNARICYWRGESECMAH